MRIVAGTHRGRHLLGPNSSDIRPTADRLRESIFNALGQHCEGLRVLDLFAGTGAMALEALSRQATSALLVDNSWNAIGLCKQNIKNLKLEAQSEVWHMDAFEALLRTQTQGRSFELVFADPPYAFRNWKSLWTPILEGGVLASGGRLVIERDKRCVLPTLPSELFLYKEIKCADSVVSLLVHARH